MAKEIKATVKVQIAAGKATPAPPIGPALAPHGLNIAEFCQKFNAATQAMAGRRCRRQSALAGSIPPCSCAQHDATVHRRNLCQANQ